MSEIWAPPRSRPCGRPPCLVPVARRVRPGDEEQLNRQPGIESVAAAGNALLVSLPLDRHMEVGWEDSDQGGDAPGAPRPAGPRVQRRQATGDLRHAAGIDELAVARDVRRHDALVRASLD